MGEIIHLHIGQCGVQLGSALWEQYMTEHGVDSSGGLSMKEPLKNGENKINKLFYETKEGIYNARSLFADADSFTIDSVKRGEYRQLFNSSNLLCHKEESGGVHPKVNYGHNRKFDELFTGRLRQLSEGCESLEGLTLTHSLCGGFGSGYVSHLLFAMMEQFPKKLKISYSMFPSPKISNLVVEPYNMILGMTSLINYADFSVLFDNEALYNICSNQMDNESPNYADINRMVAQALSTSFSSTRFNSSINSNINEMLTNLVPYPRIHFAMPSYAPFGRWNKNQEVPLSIEDMTNTAFNQESTMLSSNLKIDKYISCCVTYRGNTDLENAINTVNKLKTLRGFKTVDWCPTGFKTGITYQNPVCTKQSSEVGVLINSTNFTKVFEREIQKFDRLYRLRSFIYWFIFEGMEEREFSEARENLESLKNNYEEMNQFSEENFEVD